MARGEDDTLWVAEVTGCALLAGADGEGDSGDCRDGCEAVDARVDVGEVTRRGAPARRSRSELEPELETVGAVDVLLALCCCCCSMRFGMVQDPNKGRGEER